MFFFAQLVGGILFGSLALLADAVHMLSDVGGLAIALGALALTQRPASTRHTFGLERAEVLGAQANGVLLLASSGWIVVEAAGRLDAPPEIAGGGVLVVATLGLAVNVGSAVLLSRASGRSLNMRGAYVHMLADAAGSVGVIVAALAAVLAQAYWVDPVASLLIAALVVATAFRLLREATHVLLEGTPSDVDPDAVEEWLVTQPGIGSVHHLHLWSLASETAALSAHIVIDDAPSLHAAQARGEELKAELGARFGIAHATLELECHGCLDAEHA